MEKPKKMDIDEDREQIPETRFPWSSAAKEYLQSVPIRELLPEDLDAPSTPETAFSAHPYVAWVYNTDPIDTALSVCAAHQVSGCPVWNSQLSKCIGLVDLNDLASFVVQISDQVFGTSITRFISSGNGNIPESELDKVNQLWKETTVESVMNISGRNHMIPLPYRSSLFDACEILAQGIHRMPLLSPEGDDVIAIISQSLVLQYLADHLDQLGEKPKLLIQQVLSHAERTAEMDLRARNPYRVVSVCEDDLVIDAFRKMRDEEVSGVAVLNTRDRFKMLGVISVSDVKSIITPTLGVSPSLYRTVGELVKFLQSGNQQKMLGQKVVAVTPIDTLGMAVTKLVDNGIHRVFVVRAHETGDFSTMLGNVPMSVLSPTDVLIELIRT